MGGPDPPLQPLRSPENQGRGVEVEGRRWRRGGGRRREETRTEGRHGPPPPPHVGGQRRRPEDSRRERPTAAARLFLESPKGAPGERHCPCSRRPERDRVKTILKTILQKTTLVVV